MSESGFALGDGKFPDAADAGRARSGLERWQEAVARTGDPDLQAAAANLLGDGASRQLLNSVFGNSSFLTLCAEQEPAFTVSLFTDGPDASCRRIMDSVAEISQKAASGEDPARSLRFAKRRLALTTALADIAEVWSLEAVTGSLSDFADAAIDCALSYLLAQAAGRGVIGIPDVSDPSRDSGLIVIGMGKLGARELNYSSDIDLIVLYDTDRIRTESPDSLQQHFVRLTRNLVKILSERTTDGYVFRTDLRLRPDPGSTPPAMSVIAAETYYETLGQNWERAAFIKARAVAGDRNAGNAFLEAMRPFVWRKNLDFAAIQDIHSIKRQINAHRGGGTIAIAGHNIKLGRGGIREIEFFVQTQQLIWGGRLPELRAIETIGALSALAAAGKISPETSRELIDAYRYLRRVEHRLQMLNDEQTHSLPKDREKLREFAVFMGYPDDEAFGTAWEIQLRAVESHYADLFEDAPALSVENGIGGNLVFTGGEEDPDTLVTLEKLGFSNPRLVDDAIRGWHHGRCRAMRSTRARELLTELTPILLKALSDMPDPDAVFLAFDRFLNGLPAGIQLFSMFHAKPELLQLVAEIMGVAPRLAQHLTRRPWVLESVLGADFFEPPPSAEDLLEELSTLLSEATDIEDVLDISRRWSKDRRFQVGVQSLRGHLSPAEAAVAWTNIAEAAIGALYPRVESEFAGQHGRIQGSDMAIVGMGKLGGREMTATSDLDLIFIYGTPGDSAISNGDRPLHATQYFARLSQRLINALTAPTAEGRFYEVDMRLRPSGKAGPIAVSLEAFQRYQSEEAWTWEQMALTRARVVSGPPDLVANIDSAIRRALTKHRDRDVLLADVADMRKRLETEKRTDSIWEIKQMRGGLVDIEFIAQYLQLLHAHDHPEILSTSTLTALRNIRSAELLSREIADDLVDGLLLWQCVQERVRLSLSEAIEATGEDDAPKALRMALRDIGGLDFQALVTKIRETRHRVHAHFVTIVEAPAEKLESEIGDPK
jgi:glutamate-ammonia-ligase adenylyltransferase